MTMSFPGQFVRNVQVFFYVREVVYAKYNHASELYLILKAYF